ncbi:hypothetical protein ACH5RR_013361 [Cinchona calisaya]|uniref:Alcohol dehydrogenase-like C-terminal domain-containing protein n=1 Tax=Cinchona calisaya TaxID=153742 RepID=A0ABD3A154_9GENT
MVVAEHFVIRWPENLPLDAGAPLLCAGITTYSPLRNFKLDKPGIHVGVVGLGGLGHLAVKFAKAFVVKVSVISTSVSKKQEAMQKLGADAFLVSSDPEQMQKSDSITSGHAKAALLLPLVLLPVSQLEKMVVYAHHGSTMQKTSKSGGGGWAVEQGTKWHHLTPVLVLACLAVLLFVVPKTLGHCKQREPLLHRCSWYDRCFGSTKFDSYG